MHIVSTYIAAVAALSLSGAAWAFSSQDARVEKDKIESTYKAEKQRCKSLAGNAEDVCEEEAKGHKSVALAELALRQAPTAENRYKLAKAKADAAYEVAKEKCDDLQGNAEDQCETEAKAVHAKALEAIQDR